jgi:hypothetical protein
MLFGNVDVFQAQLKILSNLPCAIIIIIIILVTCNFPMLKVHACSQGP